MKVSINHLRVFWFGEDRHLVVLGQHLEGAKTFRSVKKMEMDTEKLRSLLEMFEQGIEDAQESIQFQNDQGETLVVSQIYAENIRTDIIAYLGELKMGALQRYKGDPSAGIPDFSQN